MSKTAELEQKLWMIIIYAYKQGDENTTQLLNVPWSKIRSIIKKYIMIRYVENKLSTDRKRLISERMKKDIFWDVSNNHHLASKDIVIDVKTSG